MVDMETHEPETRLLSRSGDLFVVVYGEVYNGKMEKPLRQSAHIQSRKQIGGSGNKTIKKEKQRHYARSL